MQGELVLFVIEASHVDHLRRALYWIWQHYSTVVLAQLFCQWNFLR